MTKQEIMDDPSTPEWVKSAILYMDELDVVDVLNHLDILRDYFQQKFDDVLEGHQL